MDESGIGRDYADDFLGYIDRHIGLSSLKNKRLLEIGAGTGYLLHRLQKHGAEVLGYEPGFSRIGRFDIPVIEKLFPSTETVGQQFDLVIASLLLEHTPQPGELLKTITASLIPQTGQLVLSVTDCESHLRNGDLSMLLHEHFSYFTKISLERFLRLNGLSPCSIESSGFGGTVYALAKAESSLLSGLLTRPAADDSILSRFENSIEQFRAFLHTHKNKTIGLYVPIRALNYIGVCLDDIRSYNIDLRLFDDSHVLHGRYFPGLPMPVESRAQLLDTRPDLVVVFSYTFGSAIARALCRQLPDNVGIVTSSELFGSL